MEITFGNNTCRKQKEEDCLAMTFSPISGRLQLAKMKLWWRERFYFVGDRRLIPIFV